MQHVSWRGHVIALASSIVGVQRSVHAYSLARLYQIWILTQIGYIEHRDYPLGIAQYIQFEFFHFEFNISNGVHTMESGTLGLLSICRHGSAVWPWSPVGSAWRCEAAALVIFRAMW